MSRLTLYELVDSVGTVPFEGVVFRHISPTRTCTSGEGARQAGGRWNPPDSFPVLYTGLTQDVVLQEFYRLADRSGIPPESFLPRTICEMNVRLESLLDLRQAANLTVIGLTLGQMGSDLLEDCQLVGEVAHKLGREGLLAPSATGSGDVLAIFELNLRTSSLVQESSRAIWEVPSLPRTWTHFSERVNPPA